ncbi:aldo/keto reductase [Solitalea sp. MAHUQ-68]|uniref:Aldo/keto reductase n=1 Tax=Solitalea agri TaxID=2953739 RepID=A0A9X2FBB9_9SPHI|nr:aldo/keto reductase [Solitalea agri]MCO4293758.1 aldo/keto reductase [Solitalea agri]
MKKVYLSDSGPKVSAAIYGFWRWGSEGMVSASQMEEIVDHCLSLGINTFDHADIYGNNSCEELFGQVIKQKTIKRDEIVLFTKCGLIKKGSKGAQIDHINSSASHIRQSVENSLRNLQTDYVDIFLLDHLDHISFLEETAGTILQLIEAGKIKHFGVANLTASQHQLISAYLRVPVVTSHIELNLLNTSAIDDGRFDFMRQKYSKPLAWSPLAGGRILNGDDAQALRVRKKLEEVAQKYNANVEETAVAWLVKLGALPIIGALHKQRISNAARAFEIDMEHEDWYALYQATLNS